jgi:enterochelin esterase-like enzyme
MASLVGPPMVSLVGPLVLLARLRLVAGASLGGRIGLVAGASLGTVRGVGTVIS